MIGDAANTAARIDGMTKDAPYDLLLADATRIRPSAEPDDLVEHATLPIRGRAEPGRLWSLRVLRRTPLRRLAVEVIPRSADDGRLDHFLVSQASLGGYRRLA